MAKGHWEKLRRQAVYARILKTRRGEKTEIPLASSLSMTHFKLEVRILCQGVSKILTANRISAIIFPFYHLKEEIRSFPTMYNTRGCS